MKKLLIHPLPAFLCLAIFFVGCKDKKSQTDQSGTAAVEATTKSTANTWAEKLGWPAGKKVIILHADDIGMCPEANVAAKKMLTDGVIQSAAVMIPCPNAKEAITWAAEHPAMDIGLHLTLTSEWKTYRWGTVTPAAEVPGLLDEDHKMWHEVPQVVQHASAEEVEKEIRSQIEQSITWGYRPDHMDTHMGTLYADPGYVKVFIKVAEEYGIPANIIDISKPEVLAEFKRQGYPLDDRVVKMVDGYTLPKLDYFSSAPKAETYEGKIEKFKALVNSVPPGLTEIIFHPSVLTENLKTITNSWQQRAWEAQMFSDPDLIQFFRDEDIIFTNWKEIMERFEKQK
ncbi:polysaccharide deacetylase family protein [Flavobacteriaceae bacterium F89]|uniref:Polysaccharide deacetylase family protein n=1 Tax=Cerina litoralis TaxID=2874477 RepID=A0AAE3JSB9_9FLAO|nr:polysaccharide deacetylase family protein [Cerina litoralis]MCG2460427.1 polysaccharide deacetylase family protein [Cerina litoralis]